MKTAEEILDRCLFNKFDEIDKAIFIKAMKLYANAKLDEALLNSYEIDDEVPFKVVDKILIKSLKDKV